MTENRFRQIWSGDIWTGAAVGLAIAVVITTILTLNEVFFGRWRFFVAILFFVSMAVIFVVPGLVFSKINSQIPPYFRFAILASIPVVSLPFIWADRKGALIAGLCIILSSSLCGATLWNLRRLRDRPASPMKLTLTIGAAIVGAGTMSTAAIWFFGPGHPVAEPINAAMLRPDRIPPVLDLPDPSKRGDFETTVMSYGSGKDLRRKEYGDDVDMTTRPVDGSAFISVWKGMRGRARTAYWGFDKSQLPLNGVVYSPVGDGPYPLVLIVHGNYLMQGRSDIAFTYIAELLASHGYIVVNVDETFLNIAWYDVFVGSPETSARGWLLLEHLRQWHLWNTTPDHPFSGRIDLDQIALIGHSRGGEAVAVAAAFNRLPYFPDDANQRFDFNYNIRSVIALSPIDGQYKPTGKSTPLRDINYFVMQTAYDGDVVSFDGSAQYERIRLTPGSGFFKASLYAYGANHSNFTTEWIGSEKPGPADYLFNTVPLMAPEKQRRLATTYIHAFLDSTIKNDQRYVPLFKDPRVARRWLPATVYINQYQDSNTQLIATFEEDVNLESAAGPGITLIGSGLSDWYEKEVVLKWGPMGNNAVYLGWENSGGSYTIMFDQRDRTLNNDCSLTFSLAAADDPRNSEAIDFSIEIIDMDGNFAKLPLSRFLHLQPPITAQYMKADFFNSLPPSEVAFQTFSFSFADFKAVQSSLNVSEIRQIKLAFDESPSGLVILDNIGFSIPGDSQGPINQ